jgi:hypothetical protein
MRSTDAFDNMSFSVTTWSKVANRQPVDDACRETGFKNGTAVSCSSSHAYRREPNQGNPRDIKARNDTETPACYSNDDMKCIVGRGGLVLGLSPAQS